MAAKHARNTPSGSAGNGRVAMPKTNPRRKQKVNTAAQISTVRVGDLRARPSAGRNSKSWLARFLVFVFVLAALAMGAVYMYSSNLFSIEEVRVSGVDHLTAEEMSQLAAVPAGSTLLRVDAHAIEQRLKANSWVENVQVRRVFPHTLELAIAERGIAAVVEVTSVEEQSVNTWAISKDAIWLINIPTQNTQEAQAISAKIYDDATHVLHITDVPLDIHPEEGGTCTDESVLNALAIVSGFTTSLADQVAVVSATDAANTILTLTNGIQIAFGTADDIRDKERVCLKLMEEYPDQISYINVRIVDKPTWRAVNSW